MLTPIEEKFAQHQGPEDRGGCIPWMGGFWGPYGYLTNEDGRTELAHRFAYRRVHGALPAGFDVHHRCGNKRCVRLDHLQAMAKSEHRQMHRSGAFVPTPV